MAWTSTLIKIGAGGYVTSMDWAANGSYALITTDVFGTYRRKAADDFWEQMCDADRMPGGTARLGGGSFAAVVAPSDSTRAYQYWGGKMWKSDDSGDTWTECTTFGASSVDPNDQQYYSSRTRQPRAAVDPLNKDVFYIGLTYTGSLRYTLDGGTTWANVSGISDAPLSSGGWLIAFDPSQGTTGAGSPASPTRCARIYVHPLGCGWVWISNNGGAAGTWARTAASGPGDVSGMSVSNGNLWAASGYLNTLYKYNGTAWSTVSSGGDGNGTVGVYFSPSDPTKGYALGAGGAVMFSTDSGASWGNRNYGYQNAASGEPGWIEACQGSLGTYLTSSTLEINPSTGSVWNTNGVGVFEFASPTPGAFQWEVKCKGIEQLVTMQVAVPPSATGAVFVSHDRPFFYSPLTALQTYPDEYGPTMPAATINMGHHVSMKRPRVRTAARPGRFLARPPVIRLWSKSRPVQQP